MECYVLNSKYEANTIFDGWFSFIWTERFASESSFRIEMPVTTEYQSLLKEDDILMISESDQPMIIETTYIKKQEDGSKRYIVEGRDLTSWLDLRDAPWDTSYTAKRVSEIAYTIIDKQIISGPVKKRFPDISLRNISTDTSKFDYETTPGTLLENVQAILNDNSCGIRADRISTNGVYSFRFNIYCGVRRTTSFDDRDGTLINTQRIRSKKKLRNVATVAYKSSGKEDATTLYREVYANGGNENLRGPARRELRVDATNLNPNDYPGTRFAVALDRLGRAALSKQKQINATDGEIPDYVSAKYGKDYKLGDIVSYKGDDGLPTDARITEYIWASDTQNGMHQYPTIDVVPDITV